MLAEIKRLCLKHGYSQSDLATAAGVSVQYISDVLAHQKSVSDKLAKAFGYRRVVVFEKVSDTDA